MNSPRQQAEKLIQQELGRISAEKERLQNWHMLQELAGLR